MLIVASIEIILGFVLFWLFGNLEKVLGLLIDSETY